MDGTPHVVRFDATTLWHLDAAEWAPSTASFASIALRTRVRLAPDFGHVRQLSYWSRCAISGREQMQQLHRYSITSSARASTDGGTSRPSAFAVLRLMTSSTLVDCTTGRSAGFAPLRIWPV